ncbi:hypothetical protein [Novosphingobium sp.]|uniref:hypothetical protein n=1 Tax=Novosphingobium sp. TaxID=1874826 RepID=UPI00333FBE19
MHKTFPRSPALFAHAVALALVVPMPAPAQTVVAPKPVTVGDVATKPIDDLNLRKVPIAPALETAMANPYGLPAKGRCAGLQRDIAALDAALGPDIDESVAPTRRQKRDRVIVGTARSVVGGIIPFGGIVREISGANAEDNRRARYLYAGSVRRAWLKGYARARGCPIRHPA